MRLEAVNDDEGKVRDEDVKNLGTKARNRDGQWSEDLVGEWIEKKTGKSRGEVKKKR